MLKYGLIWGLVIALTGCTVGPNYRRPATVADDRPGFVHAQTNRASVRADDPNLAWWEHFGDPITADLVRQALRKNTDLQAQAARILQAEALLQQSKAAQLPFVDFNFGATRIQRNQDTRSFQFVPDGNGGFNLSPGETERFSFKTSNLEPSLSVNYVADLFGRLRRETEASEATLLSRIANFETMQHTTIAQVIRSRVQIAITQRQLEIARNNIRNWRAALEIAERRYNQGIIGPLEVHVARENVARSQSAEPKLELALQTACHALDILLGQAPGTTMKLPETLTDLPSLQAVPLDLPAALLERRPDLREAEYRLHSATAQVGVNMAQLYPDLALSGNIGYSAEKFNDLFRSETMIWTMSANLVQPLFNGGQIRARIAQAQAVVQEELAIYSGAVLTALREVEDALIQETKLQEQLQYLEVRYKEARASEQLAQNRYLEGVEQLATVLETERSRREAEDRLTAIKDEIWNARVDLLLALGGDWNLRNAEGTSPVMKSQEGGIENEG